NGNKGLIQSLIEKLIKHYDYKQIKQAVDNYATVLKGDNWWTHEWDLEEFLGSQKARKFFPGKFKPERFKTATGAKAGASEAIEDTVGKIFEAQRSFGLSDYKAAKDFCGELGAKVIEEVGWGTIVRATNF